MKIPTSMTAQQCTDLAKYFRKIITFKEGSDDYPQVADKLAKLRVTALTLEEAARDRG